MSAPPVSSGDLREDVAAALLQSDMDDGNEGLYVDDYDRLASAAVAAVRAHDVAHPEPWLIELVKGFCFVECWDATGHAEAPEFHCAACLAVPESVRSAAGLT